MTDLVVLCPSYKRPEAAKALLVSEWETTRKATVRFLVWDQDPTRDQYPQANTVLLPEETMVARTNAGAWLFSEARYLGWVADDMRFETNGWNETVVKALDRMGGGVVYGNDLVSPGSKPSHVFLSSEIVRTLGWLHHPDMRATFGDDVWEHLGKGLGKYQYLPDVKIRHLYREKDNETDFLHDMEVFQKWVGERADDDIARCARALRRAHVRKGRLRPSPATSRVAPQETLAPAT